MIVITDDNIIMMQSGSPELFLGTHWVVPISEVFGDKLRFNGGSESRSLHIVMPSSSLSLDENERLSLWMMISEYLLQAAASCVTA